VNSDTPPESAHNLIDEDARRRFEAAWRAGRPEPIEALLPPPESPKHLPTLEELVLIELEFAWKAAPRPAVGAMVPVGTRPPLVEEYLERFPSLDHPEVVRRLLEQEHEVRARCGDAPSAGEYRARFPTVGFTVSTSDSASPNAAAPPSIPGYEILGTIGRGGMGVVYRARQLSLDRLVALKVILAGAHAGAEELTRFKAEAQAAASLQHPNIVQIHEVGEHAGHPYLVMEYVEGGNLARKLNATPQTPRDAVALVETLARAVHVMHEHDIVHRDLKPHNVLLSFPRQPPAGAADASAGGPRLNEAIPKIADFGLAKHLDEADGATWSGAVLGTPGYMAPEQAAGRARHVGPAADVWALGAILYEMLTGRPPFTATASVDVLAQVMAAEPVAPRRLQPKLPRDLETITLKCLEKDPRKRYASAAALADDCAAFLRGEPIKARPTPVWRRAAKWARRRPAVAALVLVSVVAAVALVLGVLWHNARLGDALARAQAEREQARANYRLARDAVEKMLTRVGQDRLAYVPQMEHARREILQDALAFEVRFLEGSRDDPEARREAARAYGRVARINQLLGRRADAERALHEAIVLFGGLAADSAGDAGARDELVTQHHNRALLLQDGGRFAEAQAAFATAVGLGERLAAEFPAEPYYRQHLAGVRANLGILLETVGDFTGAERLYRSALEEYAELHARDRAHRGYRQELAQAHNFLAVLLTGMGRPADATASCTRAVELQQQLVKEAPEVPAYRLNLAASYLTRGNLLPTSTGSAQAQRQAEALHRQLVADFPGIPVYRRGLVKTLVNLGGRLQGEGDRGAARKALGEALDLGRQLVADLPDAPELADDLSRALINWAVLRQAEGEPAEAEKACREAEALLEKTARRSPALPGPRFSLGTARRQRALALGALGRAGEAEQAARQAIDVLSTLAADFPTVPFWRERLALARGDLVDLLRGWKRVREARPVLEASVDGFRQLAKDFPGVPKYRLNVARGLRRLSGLLTATDRAAASRAVEEAVRVQQGLVEDFPDNPGWRRQLAAYHDAFADLLPKTASPDTRKRAYNRALELREILVREHPKVAAYRLEFAASLHKLTRLFVEANGDPAMTRELARQAVEHQREGVKLAGQDAARSLPLKEYSWWCANILIGQRLHEKAERAAVELAELDPADSRGHFKAAWLLAQCVPLARGDTKLKEDRRAEVARAYEVQAVALLRRAVETGHIDTGPLRTDHAAFDVIRQREDFQALVRKLNAAKGPR
jgi:serine/threonine protein kinase/tetratricopeptide (TPR) repeat protein